MVSHMNKNILNRDTLGHWDSLELTIILKVPMQVRHKYRYFNIVFEVSQNPLKSLCFFFK